MVTLQPNTRTLVLGLVFATFLASTPVDAQAATTTQSVTRTATATATSSGQPIQPTVPVNAPRAYTGIVSGANKDAIIYQGGQLNAAVLTYTSDIFSLDITKSWSISRPAWTNLSTGATSQGPKMGGQSGTMSKDGTTFLVTSPASNTSSPFLYRYDIASKAWTSEMAPEAQASTWAFRKNAIFITDPNTGYEWLLGGTLPDNANSNEVDYLDGSGKWNADLPVKNIGGDASVALSTFSLGTAHIYNSRIYLFGGLSGSGVSRTYQNFQSLTYIDISNPSAPKFGTQVTLGAVPDGRQNHCSVMTASDKVIVFGGYNSFSKKTFSDVWILDLVTNAWLPLASQEGDNYRRYQHTCDLVGANMVVYGGRASPLQPGSSDLAYAGDVQVFDIVSAKWVQSYVPKQDTTTRSRPNDNGGSGNGSGLSVGAIIGIVVGALVALGAVFGLIFYKRRQKQIEIREAEMEKEAYLASLRPESENLGSKMGQHSPRSPNAAASVINTPGMAHLNANYAAMDDLISGAASPGQNVQYLMQHLPDGTIAVQPVYLDTQALHMQGSASPSAGYVSPPMPASATIGSPGAYYAPPMRSPGGASPSAPASAYPVPTRDPFASPPLGHAPLPPNYHHPPGSA